MDTIKKLYEYLKTSQDELFSCTVTKEIKDIEGKVTLTLKPADKEPLTIVFQDQNGTVGMGEQL